MKYIDADKLYKKIDEQMAKFAELEKETEIDEMSLSLPFYYQGKRIMCSEILTLIDALPQEHQEVDLVAKLKHHLVTTPKEQLEKEWKELEHWNNIWNNIGPTVQEFLYGKQPEVDLDKEILDWIGDEDSCKNGKWTWYECNKMIRHFYKRGLDARKEEIK